MANTKTQIHGNNTQTHDLTPPELGSGNLTSEIAPDDGSGWACESISLLGGSVGYYLIKGKISQKYKYKYDIMSARIKFNSLSNPF